MCYQAHCRKIELCVFFIALVALSLPYFSNAALIEKDFLLDGDKLLTLDQQTNLEWLDLTKTAGLSYDDVRTLMVAGGSFNGFRYATLSEVETLFGHAEIASPYPNTTNVSEIMHLLSLMGTPLDSVQDLGSFPPTGSIRTRIADVLTGDWRWLVEPDPLRNIFGVGGYKASFLYNSIISNYTTGFSQSSAEANPWKNVIYADTKESSFDSWLVRGSENGQDPNGQVVPEPASILLTGFGIICLVGVARQKVKR